MRISDWSSDVCSSDLTAEVKARSAARVERLEVVEAVPGPSLPGAGRPGNADPVRARVTLSWPLANIGPSLPNLLATVAGNLFELKQFSGLRIEDIRLHAAFADAYPGSSFEIGRASCRERVCQYV